MLRNILTAALALFVVMACETYSPNPARRAPGEGKEVTVNVNVPSAPAPHSDAAAPASDSGESPEADAAIEESDSHHPNPGQGGDADAAVAEADAEVTDIEPDAAAEAPDASEEPHQAPDSDVVDQAPDAAAPAVPREKCVQVRAECALYVASSIEVTEDGDPTGQFHLVAAQRFCFDPTTTSVIVNVVTDSVDRGDLIWALSVRSANESGDWCSNATGSNVRREQDLENPSCFVGLTPDQLGFEEHCSPRDVEDTMNWLWRAENLAD